VPMYPCKYFTLDSSWSDALPGVRWPNSSNNWNSTYATFKNDNYKCYEWSTKSLSNPL